MKIRQYQKRVNYRLEVTQRGLVLIDISDRIIREKVSEIDGNYRDIMKEISEGVLKIYLNPNLSHTGVRRQVVELLTTIDVLPKRMNELRFKEKLVNVEYDEFNDLTGWTPVVRVSLNPYEVVHDQSPHKYDVEEIIPWTAGAVLLFSLIGLLYSGLSGDVVAVLVFAASIGAILIANELWDE